MAQQKFDLIVIGGGPGGYTAAIKAHQMGLDVAVVEKENLGGVCLNWGCIPTKTLLESAAIYNTLKHSSDFGIMLKQASFDFSAIVKRSRASADKLRSGVEYLMKKNKITVIKGVASFLDKNTLSISNQDNVQQITSEYIIIATGSSPRALPDLPFDASSIWNYRHAMTPDEQPESLLIVGSGAIGVEFADFYNTFGTKVAIVEKQPNILPSIDLEITEIMHKELVKQGIDIYVNSSIEKFEKKNNDVVVQIVGANGQREERSFKKILIAVGVAPNTKDLNLQNVGIQTQREAIVVNSLYQTNVPNIYAIGDVIGGMCLAHKASHEAISCVEAIIRKECHTIKKEEIPACIYTHPQIASIGLTEEELKANKQEYRVGKYPYAANGKAIATSKTTGVVKILTHKDTGEILGAHIIGDNATEIIHSYVVAKSTEAVDKNIQTMVFAHPTLSEMLHEATLDLDGSAINK